MRARLLVVFLAMNNILLSLWVGERGTGGNCASGGFSLLRGVFKEASSGLVVGNFAFFS